MRNAELCSGSRHPREEGNPVLCQAEWHQRRIQWSSSERSGKTCVAWAVLQYRHFNVSCCLWNDLNTASVRPSPCASFFVLLSLSLVCIVDSCNWPWIACRNWVIWAQGLKDTKLGSLWWTVQKALLIVHSTSWYVNDYIICRYTSLCSCVDMIYTSFAAITPWLQRVGPHHKVGLHAHVDVAKPASWRLCFLANNSLMVTKDKFLPPKFVTQSHEHHLQQWSCCGSLLIVL